MKILLDPNVAILIKDLSDAECAEILRCIFEYPNRDCEIGLWKYIKTQIDRDARKYKDKCDRALALVEKRKETDTKSSTISSTKSSVIVSSIEKHNDKDIDIEKEKDSSNANLPVENSVENGDKPVENYFISEYFSFQQLAEKIPAFKNYIQDFIPAIVIRAERTLKQKRKSQLLTMRHIVEWIEQEKTFYQQNHKDEK